MTWVDSSERGSAFESKVNDDGLKERVLERTGAKDGRLPVT
jgi:hypothetical protein